MDSTSGHLEPASGARASIPGQEYWPEGTASRVQAAQASKPTGDSLGSSSNGKNLGSRRKNYETTVATSLEVSVESIGPMPPEASVDPIEDCEDFSSDYVVYQSEHEVEEEYVFELDKKLGHPHPFIDPKVKKPIEGPHTSEELRWNWRKPEKEQ